MIEKLSVWAERYGVHHKTAYKWFREGRMPFPTRMIGPKTIVVETPDLDDASSVGKTAIYARVSSADQKDDLERQVHRLLEFAVNEGIQVHKVFKEIGSGLNEKRKQLNDLLSDVSYGNIIVEHKDRLGRHNVYPVMSALKASGRNVTIVDDTELDDDLVADVLSLMTSYAARLHGKRSAENKVKRAMKKLEQVDE